MRLPRPRVADLLWLCVVVSASAPYWSRPSCAELRKRYSAADTAYRATAQRAARLLAEKIGNQKESTLKTEAPRHPDGLGAEYRDLLAMAENGLPWAGGAELNGDRVAFHRPDWPEVQRVIELSSRPPVLAMERLVIDAYEAAVAEEEKRRRQRKQERDRTITLRHPTAGEGEVAVRPPK